MKKIGVAIDPKLLWRLSDEADEIGSSASRILEGMLVSRYSKIPAPSAPVALMRTRDAVAHLHAEGFSDEEIAVRVERVVLHVARVRRELGLKPNRGKLVA